MTSSVTWETYYENMLLDMWEKNLPELKRSQRHTYVYMEMSTEFAKAGFEVHWLKIRSKMDNLTRKYKNEVRAMNELGAQPSTWRHFKRMQQILIKKEDSNLEEFGEEDANSSELRAEDANSPELILGNTDGADENIFTHSTDDSFLAGTSEDSFSLFSKGKKQQTEKYADLLKESTIDEPPPKKKCKSTKKKPEMTAFEVSMIEIVKERTENLRDAAMARIEVLNRFVDETAEYQRKMLEIFAESCRK